MNPKRNGFNAAEFLMIAAGLADVTPNQFINKFVDPKCDECGTAHASIDDLTVIQGRYICPSCILVRFAKQVSDAQH